tara:strand:- start:3069 stop:4355 length:1287 start_codon:yes stop_codon:yes gene_type:complete
MSYLDHLRGMQSQFDEARDQAQANTDAVQQNAYIRAETKKNDYLGQIARHYEDIENKLQTGAAAAGGLGALVKHGKRLHATLMKRAKAPEAPDLDKPGTAKDTPADPTDAPTITQKPGDDVKTGDIETPRTGEALKTGIPDTGGGVKIDDSEAPDLGDYAGKSGDLTGDVPDGDGGKLVNLADDAQFEGIPKPGTAASVMQKIDAEAATRDRGGNIPEAPARDAGAAAETPAAGGAAEPAASGTVEAAATAGKKPLFDLGETAGDVEGIHDAPGAARRIASQDIGAAQRTEAPLEGGEGLLGAEAPGSNILRPNALAKGGTALEKAAPESSLADMGGDAGKTVGKIAAKGAGSVVGDVLGDVGLGFLDSIPIIGDIAMAAQMIGSAVMGSQGEKKESDVVDKANKAAMDAPVATGVASTGFDIKSMLQ